MPSEVTAWRDGTSHLLFEPIARLEKLAALIARPAINLALSHGLLAPLARWGSLVVPSGRPAAPDSEVEQPGTASSTRTPRAWTWAALMRRGFDLDVRACPRCRARLRVIATVQAPLSGPAILAQLGRSRSPEPPGPAPPAPTAVA